MGGNDHSEGKVASPAAKAVAFAGAALPAVTLAAVSLPLAAAAVLLHWRHNKSLKDKYAAARATLKSLLAERDEALAERDAAIRNIMVLQDLTEEQAEVFASAAQEAKELSLKYEEVLMDAGELQARLARADGFNQELQQTIKRERKERTDRERHIAELEKKIQAQRALIKKLQCENDGPFSARSDSSAKELVTPPASEVEKKKSSWPSKLPRPPVPFRDVTRGSQGLAE